MLGPSDLVQVTCSDHPLTIFRPRNRSFFDLLRNKLHWAFASDHRGQSAYANTGVYAKIAETSAPPAHCHAGRIGVLTARLQAKAVGKGSK